MGPDNSPPQIVPLNSNNKKGPDTEIVWSKTGRLFLLPSLYRERRGGDLINKNHLKNVGPIHHCEPPHANSPDVASGTVARRLRIDVHDDIDNDDNDDNA